MKTPHLLISPPVLAIGVTSDPAMESIEAALIRTDGALVIEPVAAHSIAYGEGPRDMIRAACAAAQLLPISHPTIEQAARALTFWHMSAVNGVLEQAGVFASDISVIGFQGHVLNSATQIADPDLMAELLSMSVVSDMTTETDAEMDAAKLGYLAVQRIFELSQNGRIYRLGFFNRRST
jgi:1,6-anhydro-N-acetylmuramate kinase